MRRIHCLLMTFCAMALLGAIALADIYEQLSITKNKVKERLVESIGYGMLVKGDQEELVTNARNLPVPIRVAGIRELIRFAKEYSSTPEFEEDYKAWRKSVLSPNEKTKLGIPKLGKMLDNKVNNKLNKADNEKKYPEDPAVLIKTRLTEFLALVPTVDFDAEIQDNQFVNPEYVKKSAQWKACFRAGREVVMAAQEEAEKWLAELTD